MSEAYLMQIQQLVELQKVDDEIFNVKKIREEAPLYLEDLKTRHNALSERREKVKDKLAHLNDQKKRLAIELDDETARLKKSRNKLMQVGNDREYQLMQREVDSMEKITRARDEEKLAVLEELNSQNAILEDIDKEYNAINSELEEKKATLEKTLNECDAKLASLNKQRQTASQFIPRAVFQRYEFIKKRLEHPVIVEVDEGICSGCNIAIPPQKFIDLQIGQQILSCPNCQRLIYWSMHFTDPDKAGKNEMQAENADTPEKEPVL